MARHLTSTTPLRKEPATTTSIVRTITVTLDLELIEGEEDHVIEMNVTEFAEYVKGWVEGRVADITDSLA